MRWVWVTTAYGHRTGAAQRFYPGDAWVDVVAVDGYDTRPPKTTPEVVFAAAAQFAAAHGKSFGIAEFGATTKDVQRQLDWTRATVEWARAHGVVYAIYWASRGGICLPTCVPAQPTRDYLATVTG